MKKAIESWARMLYDGLYQIVGFNDDGNVEIETGRDVSDGYKCRELWKLIKEEFPEADNYKSYCCAYREGSDEFDAYIKRDKRRYDRYWRH